jgi:hypothetical protein
VNAGTRLAVTEIDVMELLGRLARAPRFEVTRELDDALMALDEEMARLAEALQVEYVGPGVGMADMKAQHVYRLVVRHHVRDTTTAGWGLRVCDALDNNDLRPMWSVQGVGRLRKQQVFAALPAFFRGYAEAVAAAGKADTPAGRRVSAMARALA